MDGIGIYIDKFQTYNGNTATFADSNYKATITYNPADKSIRIKAYNSCSKEPIVNRVFHDSDKMKYIVAVSDENITDNPEGGNSLGKIKAGDCLPINGKIHMGNYGVTLPDGREGYMSGQLCKSRAMLDEAFPKEWITFDKKENAQITLEFEPIGNGMMKVIETTMWAPLPNGSIPMAGISSYIGTVHENKLTLTKSGGMTGAYSDNPADFEDMESPEEIIFIPVIYDGILFDGNKFHADLNNF